MTQSELPDIEPEELQMNMENTVKLLESDRDTIYQAALVLGGSGSIGQQVVRALHEGGVETDF